ncbi:hypothetical protein [Haloarcula sp. JP-L23]|uniref:hypothetical protein n=1 Tax=Haloarcula sp. JP-L23 TaxID=2716717 RepID=UPI00140EAEA0|nr:hypothetical protein G9465_12195 [Haloarcula sp. JP-L23]
MTEDRAARTAAQCLDEARDVLGKDRPHDALEAIGNAAHFAAQAARNDGPVATARVERASDAQDSWTELYPGQTKEIDIHGKATVRIQSEVGGGDDDE